MAALPSQVTDHARKSGEHKQQGPTSHGRGGAGNIKVSKADITPPDPTTLETPTIKSKVYTTGRGGTGNMAKNDNAEDARRAQDVTATPRRDSSHQAQHVGRGGGGNVFKPSKEEVERAKKNGDSAIADDEHASNGTAHKKSLAEKAMEFLSGKK